MLIVIGFFLEISLDNVFLDFFKMFIKWLFVGDGYLIILCVYFNLLYVLVIEDGEFVCCVKYVK